MTEKPEDCGRCLSTPCQCGQGDEAEATSPTARAPAPDVVFPRVVPSGSDSGQQEGRIWCTAWTKRWRLEFGGNDKRPAMKELMQILRAEGDRVAARARLYWMDHIETLKAKHAKELSVAVANQNQNAVAAVNACEHYRAHLTAAEARVRHLEAEHAGREYILALASEHWDECKRRIQQAEAESSRLRASLETLRDQWNEKAERRREQADQLVKVGEQERARSLDGRADEQLACAEALTSIAALRPTTEPQ